MKGDFMSVNNTESRDVIVIVDDSKMNRDILSDMLSDKFVIYEAENGKRAMELFHLLGTKIILVLLDIVMPVMDGFETLERMNEEHIIDNLPVILISAQSSPEYVDRAFALGVTDYISRPFDAALVEQRVLNTIMLFARQKHMTEEMIQKNQTLLEEIQYLRSRDQLTGQFNFEGFRNRAAEIMRKRPTRKYALWYFDIKHFKNVNDVFGYQNGDRLLTEWARIISCRLRDGEILGRITADNMVALTYYEESDELKKMFWECTEEIKGFLNHPGVLYEVRTVAGVYLLEPGEAEQPNVNQMIDRARLTQRSIKQLNGSQVGFFSEELWQKKWRELKITSHMEEALKNGEIRVWFQPQYNFTTGQMIGAEALARWNHSSLGWLSPAEFIPVLEKNGQISIFDHFIWEACCRYMRKWLDEDNPISDISLSVNVSRNDLYGMALCEELLALIRKYRLKPSMLRLEITEGAYMEEPAQLIDGVHRLHDLGFTVEMDDFGSGFSSLNTLKDVPVDVLKLDLRFLEGSGDSTRGGNILSSVIRMAHWLDVAVIAEGVETRSQAEFLENLGCSYMQGYYFAKPMPVEEFEKRLSEAQGCGMLVSAGGIAAARTEELLDSRSAGFYLFQNCIGPAALCEYNAGNLEVMMINDDFLQTLQLSREEFVEYRMQIQTVFEESAQLVDCLSRAVEEGCQSQELTLKGSSRSFRVKVHYIASSQKAHCFVLMFQSL